MAQQVIHRNNIKIYGNGEKTLLFGHGFGCDQEVWSGVAPAFTEQYRVVLFDYVGSGQSDKSQYSIERYNSLHGYKQDLLDVCDELQLKNILFVGHSVSSMIGMLASIERPELFEKLVMIGPSPYYLNDEDYQGGFDQSDIAELLDMMEINYKEWAKYLAPVVMQNEERPGLAQEFEQILCANDPVIARKFAEVTFLSDVRSELSKVHVPTLILQPQFDAIAPPNVSQYVHEHIDGSQLVVMEAMGHNPHLSDPEETVYCIKDFLEQ
ncbi:sigma-B regulation protein RsbQ [Planomicrobium koreense]|uniref:Sigma-B regulation protein RsbQ n=1 Tax=Planococcus koreensis TaxID=112331 RepID=A0A7W8CRD4_9BACL|nr:alpha/beta hydrolase [Planococcus koreensis]MBB5180193.1 sigma-B regulation protein RsbQ [Planococcus koreensis]